MESKILFFFITFEFKPALYYLATFVFLSFPFLCFYWVVLMRDLTWGGEERRDIMVEPPVPHLSHPFVFYTKSQEGKGRDQTKHHIIRESSKVSSKKYNCEMKHQLVFFTWNFQRNFMLVNGKAQHELQVPWFFFHFSFVPNMFPSSTQWVPNMFPRFPMCSPRVFLIAPGFNPICYAESPPLFTYRAQPKGGGTPSFHRIFYFGAGSIVSIFFAMGQSNWLIAKHNNNKIKKLDSWGTPIKLAHKTTKRRALDWLATFFLREAKSCSKYKSQEEWP